jgi:transcriptional antiterminator RfaH
MVHTKPAGEILALTNLERQGYQTYLPQLALEARAPQSRERVVPLFPRYLFLRLNEGCQSLAPVRSSFGVSTIVRFGAAYALVPDAVIEGLRARADRVTGLHKLAPRPALAAGTAVRITGGAFEGLDGIFEREAGAERVIVLLRLLGREVQVGVPAHLVLPGYAA